MHKHNVTSINLIHFNELFLYYVNDVQRRICTYFRGWHQYRICLNENVLDLPWTWKNYIKSFNDITMIFMFCKQKTTKIYLVWRNKILCVFKLFFFDRQNVEKHAPNVEEIYFYFQSPPLFSGNACAYRHIRMKNCTVFKIILFEKH